MHGIVAERLTSSESVLVLDATAHGTVGEIAPSPGVAIRQLAHRAREHVQARRPRHRTDPQVSQRVTERFLAAVMGGDLKPSCRPWRQT